MLRFGRALWRHGGARQRSIGFQPVSVRERSRGGIAGSPGKTSRMLMLRFANAPFGVIAAPGSAA
jgi:hypothetical protein